MTWWKVVIAVVLFAGAAAITVKGLTDQPPPATEVQLAKVKKGAIVRTVAGAGKVEAATTVKISSNLSGDLIERNVKVGDRVSRGQVLGRIDGRKFAALAKQANAAQSAAKADMQAAQVDVDRTARELARIQGLQQKSMSSQAEVDTARSAKDSAEARLASARERVSQAAAAFEEAEKNLAYCTLSSPIDGTVIETSREVGERVRGSDFSEDIVMTIAALSSMQVKIEVGEHEVVHLKLGQKADVTVDAIEGQTFEGTVSEIAQKALVKNAGTESEVTTFPVTVALDTRPIGVLTGMNAEVRISAESRSEALVVPIQAVTVRPEKSLPDATGPTEAGTSLKAVKRTETLAKVVFVVDAQNKAHVRRVKTGISSETDFEILEGVQEGDQVVEGPYRTLAKELNDGALIKLDSGGPGNKPNQS